MSNKNQKQESVHNCTLSLTRHGEGFAVCPGFKKDLFIPKKDLNGAFHGDEAQVAITDRKLWEGKVVRVLKRAKEEFSGAIYKNDKGTFLIPRDQRVPSHIKIETEGKDLDEKDIYLVKITNWGIGAEIPAGKIEKKIGRQGENDTEMEAIASEHGFRSGHGNELTRESEKINERGITAEDLAGRRDFRKIPTFTIDPADAKDFDDAISVRPLPNGLYEIGVHIADVSHYVRPGTALDREAGKRATSVYLVDRVIPMLPEILSNNLCSLLPNKDRLTFSAVFEIDGNGKVHGEWFGKTVIHSARRFTYDEVQETIESQKGEHAEEIGVLNRIAKRLRKERFEKGSVGLDSVEIKFKLDEKGHPIGVYKKEQKDAHKLVEEFMLLANKKVAEKIFRRGDDMGRIFVYRNHELPDSDKIEDLKEILVNFGYNIPKTGSKATGLDSNTLNRIIEEFEGKAERSLIMWIILRSMSKAEYSTANLGHYGLAFDSYTHFTSPIRRYPDIMVHRLLDAHLSGKKIKESKKDYEKLCKNASEMERKAMNAERESIKYKQVEFVLDKIGEKFDGIITGMTEFGMYIEAQDIFCEGMVSLRDIKDDYYLLDKKGFTLTGQKKKKKYRVGDAVHIELVSANLKNRTIDFRLLP